jgi:hypothetical protein
MGRPRRRELEKRATKPMATASSMGRWKRRRAPAMPMRKQVKLPV